MSEEEKTLEKSTKISLTGDVKNCGHCESDDKRFKELSTKGYEYQYIDVNSDQGQQNLKDWGIEEGQKVDIPITKVETCSWDSKNPTDKKCKTSDWKDSMWTDLEQGKLPE